MDGVEQRSFSRATLGDMAWHAEEHTPHTCAMRCVLRGRKQGCQRRAGLSTTQVNVAKAEYVVLKMRRAIGKRHTVEPLHAIEKAALHLQPIFKEPEKLA